MDATLNIEDMTKPTSPMPEKEDFSIRFTLSEKFPELHFFALLCSFFGNPNGPITFFGDPGGSPDGPFKWDFLFSPNGKLNLQ